MTTSTSATSAAGSLGQLVEVVEHTDPICSWAWGTEPKLRLLRWRHGHRLAWRVVMGGLVGDAGAGRPDWDPELAARPMSAYWRRSSAYTGQPYPHPMRRMARSTDPAGRAVKAAAMQGDDVAARVLRRFRESTFVFGRTPETAEQFVQSARGVPGLDVDRWLADLEDPRSEAAYRADWAETRAPNDHVRFLQGDDVGIGSMKHSEGHDRYAFPTLIMRGPGGERTVPGWMPYQAYVDALEAALPGCTSDPRPDPTAVEAFATWGVLTECEVASILGPEALNAPDSLPDDVVAHFWGAGLVYFSSAEAQARDLPPVTPSQGRALADLAASFELAQAQVEAISEPEWGAPTPCADWDVRALVNHMVGSAHMVSFGIEGRHIGAEFYGNHLGPDPIRSYAEAADEVIALFRGDPAVLGRQLTLPWGALSGAELAVMFAGDHLVHAWDVARSLGRPTDFDHALVERIRRFGDAYAAAHRGPGMFDAETTAGPDATAMDRFAAFVGRRV